MRYALKFAYDGSKFEGYARQPGQCTVEGEILRAARVQGIIGPEDNIYSASRTDKGVSAAGNVIALDTDFRGDATIPALNAKLDAIIFHSAAVVPKEFNPRHARQRWYRYVLHRRDVPSVAKLQVAASPFIGEHDFVHFCKRDTGDENTILAIDSIEVKESVEVVFIDIKAQRFLWQLVRRLVSTILAVAENELDPEVVKQMLDGTAIKLAGVKPMPPENLILMDVIYDFEFQARVKGASYFLSESEACKMRSEAMSQIHNVIRA